MSMSVPNVRPPPRFSAGGTRCFRPSADMLTSLENSPGSAPVDIPPLYNQAPITDAIRAGHGNYVFSSENEVSFFGDEDTPNGYHVSISFRVHMAILMPAQGCASARNLPKRNPSGPDCTDQNELTFAEARERNVHLSGAIEGCLRSARWFKHGTSFLKTGLRFTFLTYACRKFPASLHHSH